jgi:type IV pilus assembly protein PilM
MVSGSRGLQKFLQQNLQYDVERLESLEGVTGDTVLTDPLFIDNMMTFAVPYGLALQAIGKTRIRTTLLPPEIAMERKIRSKKPWAIAAAAGLLLAMGVSTMGNASVLRSYSTERWDEQQKFVDSVQSQISTQKSAYGATEGEHKKIIENMDRLVAPLEKRAIWMELFKAVNECMPRDVDDALDQSDITLQNKIRIQSFTTMKVADVSAWHKAFADAKPESMLEEFDPRDRKAPDKKEGYIVTLKGFHLHNNENADLLDKERSYLEKTLLKNLRQWELNSGGVSVPVGKIGISHPILAFSLTNKVQYDPNQRAGSLLTGGPGGAGGYMGGMSGYMGGGEASGMPGGMLSGGMTPGGMSGYPGGGGEYAVSESGNPGGAGEYPGVTGGYPGGGSGYPGSGAGYPGMSKGGGAVDSNQIASEGAASGRR